MLRNNRRKPEVCSLKSPGKLVVITGATSGIGYETAKIFASRGADIVSINRSREKSEKLCSEIEQEFGVSCSYYLADFSKLSDIHRAGAELASLNRNIDVLIHNAGVYSTKKTYTEDGIETVFQVTYLSTFVLNYLLKEKLFSQQKARIIFVNSEGHRFALSGLHVDDLRWERHHYTGLKSYGAAKTAQLLSMYPFADCFKESGVTINAMHPGDVKTNMGENNGRLYRFFKHTLINPFAKSSVLSAEALYYLGVSPDIEHKNKVFFNFTMEEEPAPHALDVELSAKLWDKSLELGGFK